MKSSEIIMIGIGLAGLWMLYKQSSGQPLVIPGGVKPTSLPPERQADLTTQSNAAVQGWHRGTCSGDQVTNVISMVS
ncbi:MAG: hypothetical protein AAFU67_07475 [Bacteroidota bacterium]